MCLVLLQQRFLIAPLKPAGAHCTHLCGRSLCYRLGNALAAIVLPAPNPAMDPTRVSTLLLTGLMVIGLGFFIRASTKDRIEVSQFQSHRPTDAVQSAVVKYLQSRAYRPLTAAETEKSSQPEASSSKPEVASPPGNKGTANTTTLVGMVSPSVFLAIFLSGLAAVGLGCFGLIMLTLFPAWGGWCLWSVLVAPLAGLFYWRKSSRPETLVVKVEDAEASNKASTLLTIKGHRDEIAELQTAFSSELQRVS